jgi:hypothetical protein
MNAMVDSFISLRIFRAMSKSQVPPEKVRKKGEFQETCKSHARLSPTEWPMTPGNLWMYLSSLTTRYSGQEGGGVGGRFGER